MIRTLPTATDVPAVTAVQMAEADRLAIEYGISVEMLMENAAHQVARAAQLLLGDVAGQRTVCLCGSGNNGGDAIGAARRLQGWGVHARCVLATDPASLRDTARRQYEIARRIGVVFDAGDAPLGDADLIVDGLLGYNVRGAPRGTTAALIERANASGRPILAVDLPSGLDPDTGRPLGATIRARSTVTLALPKVGLLSSEASSYVGELLLADIGIPAIAFRRLGVEVGLFSAHDILRIAVPSVPPTS